MRAMTMVAGMALGLVACGGKGAEKPADQAAAAPAEAPAAAPAATGTKHTVDMEFDGKTAHFAPAELTIKSGDVVEFVVKSGPPHNVAFYADSIPAGAADALNKGMPETMAPLTGPMKVGVGETYDVSFAGAPAGEYHFFCTPHLPFGMKGKITVQ
ncbi:MAG TPA: plastocyanin/azurin family copper-binding protein [Gemmatimonadales bacterium]|nr:plastocyanin/azurin family copper-binding protein [Gemmatimonadales bacterium]